MIGRMRGYDGTEEFNSRVAEDGSRARRSKAKLLSFSRLKNLLVLSLFLQTTQADKTETLPQSTSDQQPDNENTSLPEHRLPDNLFGKGIWSSALQLGAAVDLRDAQEHPDHQFALSSFQVNFNFTGILAASHWYRGNWQFGVELCAGAQVSSETAYFVGLLPVLTYN